MGLLYIFKRARILKRSQTINCALSLGKVTQDVFIVVGSFMVFWGIAFFAYHFTAEEPILTSEIGLAVAVVLTTGGLYVMYRGDRSGRPSRIETKQ